MQFGEVSETTLKAAAADICSTEELVAMNNAYWDRQLEGPDEAHDIRILHCETVLFLIPEAPFGVKWKNASRRFHLKKLMILNLIVIALFFVSAPLLFSQENEQAADLDKESGHSWTVKQENGAT